MSKHQLQLRENVVTFLVGVGLVVSLLYAVLQRTLSDFIWGSFPVALVFGTIFILLTVREWRRSQKVSLPIQVGVNLLAVSILSPFYYAVGVVLKDTWLWARILPNDTAARQIAPRVIVAVGILAVGTALFWLRLRIRAVYGATEVVVAVVIALAQTRQQSLSAVATNPQIALALLTASIYLVVRGLDNIHHGLYKSPPDKVALALIRRLRQASTIVVVTNEGGNSTRASAATDK